MIEQPTRAQSAVRHTVDRTRKRTRIPWRLPPRAVWMLVPCALALLIIVVIPVVLTAVLSFLRIDATTLHDWVSAPFTGLKNYAAAFNDSSILGVSAGRSILISVAFSLLTTLITLPIGVLAALSVHRPFRGRGLVRAVYLIPYVIPTFVLAIFARMVFLNNYGAVDRALAALGLASRNTYWLIGPNAFWAMLVTELWAAWPFIYLLALAGLQAIPKELYEAAVLDGASPRWKLRRIVLPQISGLLKLGVLLGTLFHFGNFTLAYVMFSSPPPSSVAVLPIATYFRAFTAFDYGTASAIAVVTMLLLIVPGFIYLRMTRIASNA